MIRRHRVIFSIRWQTKCRAQCPDAISQAAVRRGDHRRPARDRRVLRIQARRWITAGIGGTLARCRFKTAIAETRIPLPSVGRARVHEVADSSGSRHSSLPCCPSFSRLTSRLSVPASGAALSGLGLPLSGRGRVQTRNTSAQHSPACSPRMQPWCRTPALPVNRVLLVLKRSQASPQYHRWLRLEQFGRQFGPADQDIYPMAAVLRISSRSDRQRPHGDPILRCHWLGAGSLSQRHPLGARSRSADPRGAAPVSSECPHARNFLKKDLCAHSQQELRTKLESPPQVTLPTRPAGVFTLWVPGRRNHLQHQTGVSD
jgi:hypothetical protein